MCVCLSIAIEAVSIAMQVALVGAPNVGKSSLVNVLSSGVPEVCDYPFTTRSIKMGHFYVNGQRHQVIGSPFCSDTFPPFCSDAFHNFLTSVAVTGLHPLCRSC